MSYMLRGVARLPFGVLYALSDMLYLIAYYVVRYRRKVVSKNLAESFPEKTDRERTAIARQFYRNLTDYIVETVKLLHITDDEMRSRMEFVNGRLIDNYLEQGRSVVIYFSHCFNWEWAPSFALWTKYAPYPEYGGWHVAAMGQIYRPLRNKWFDSLMLGVRTRFGTRCIAKQHALREFLSFRRDGIPAVVGFMSDQKPSHGDPTYVTMFLNHPTAMITGTETLARRLDMAVIYWDMEKVGRGRYRVTCRLVADQLKNLPPMTMTAKYAQMLETTIRRNPSIWLWTHKRWKIPVTLPQQ